MPINRFYALLAILPLATFLPSIHARADTNAVTLQTSDGVGFVPGAIGFTFIPTTNLNVTSVGYHDAGAVEPIITFWSGTNFAFASYALPPGNNSGLFVTTNVTLTLLAGQQYTITVQDGALSSNRSVQVQFSFAPHFQVAPDLAAYSSTRVNPSGGFEDLGSGTFYFGADFTYTTSSAVPVAPELTIALRDPNTAIVSWPDSPGFVLEANLALETTNWFVMTNAVNSANGTNWVVDTPLSTQKFFRLVHP